MRSPIRFIVLSLLAIVFSYVSCGDDFLDKKDITSINSDSFYNTEGDAVASINAVYSGLQNLGLWGRRIHFMLDFSSDEVGTTPNTQGPPLELLLHTFGPSGNEHIENPWNWFYKIIAQSNITLTNVPDIEMDESLKNRILAEARFLRALSYFYINALWNGGPLRTVENAAELNVPRGTPDEIWALVESDLAFASNNLPWEYDPSNVGRATKGAAISLLGKAHLYQEDWAAAESAFMEVINSGYYALIGEGSSTIQAAIDAMRSNHDFGVKNNEETVFEVQFLAGAGGLSWDSGSSRGQRESTIRPREYGVDGNAFYNAKPSNALIEAYEGNGGTGMGDRDPRIEAFYFTQNSMFKGEPYMPIFQNSGYAVKKYQDSTAPAADDNDVNHDVIRYADVILMAAEAKIMQNKIAEGVAMINRIRRRADPTGAILPDVSPGIDQAAAMEAIVHERRVELAYEQVRRMDLVRWGIADQFLNNFQNGKHEYFPIPQNEIDNNTELNENNPGYN